MMVFLRILGSKNSIRRSSCTHRDGTSSAIQQAIQCLDHVIENVRKSKILAEAYYYLGIIYYYGEGMDEMNIMNCGHDYKGQNLIPNYQICAPFHLKNKFQYGKGPSRDCKKAIKFFERALDLPIKPCFGKVHYHMADAYLRGNGVNQDFKKARYHFGKALEYDKEGWVHAWSSQALGSMFYNASYGMQDLPRARACFENAMGYPETRAEATHYMAHMLYCLEPIQYVAANELFKGNAEQSNCKWAQAEAWWHLAHSFYHGNGVEKNNAVALDYFKKCLAQTEREDVKKGCEAVIKQLS